MPSRNIFSFYTFIMRFTIFNCSQPLPECVNGPRGSIVGVGLSQKNEEDSRRNRSRSSLEEEEHNNATFVGRSIFPAFPHSPSPLFVDIEILHMKCGTAIAAWLSQLVAMLMLLFSATTILVVVAAAAGCSLVIHFWFHMHFIKLPLRTRTPKTSPAVAVAVAMDDRRQRLQ